MLLRDHDRTVEFIFLITIISILAQFACDEKIESNGTNEKFLTRRGVIAVTVDPSAS